MSLRKNLADILHQIDQNLEVDTEKFANPVRTAFNQFHKKFDEAFKNALEILKEQESLEKMKSHLVRSPESDIRESISSLKDGDFKALCKYLKITTGRKTTKLSAREVTENKLVKKIGDIRKQTL